MNLAREAATPTAAAAHAGAALAQLPALTGIRAFAALLVLILHTNQNFPSYVPRYVDFLHRGYLGVDLFFILSGFIITHVYLGALAAPRPRNVRVFLWHRFIRLFPAHAVVLIGLIVIQLIGRGIGVTFNTQEAWSFGDLPWHFLMLHAWGTTDVAGWNAPSWSISAEWFAYLLFPLIALGLARMPRRAAAVLGVLALAALMLAFELSDWRLKSAWIGPPALVRVMGEFVCGACLCRAKVFLGGGAGAARLADLAGAVGLIGFVVAAELGAHDFILLALLALLILGVSGGGPAMTRAFAPRPVVWLGEVSYSVYVVHTPVLLVLRALGERVGSGSWSEPVRLVAFLAALAIVIIAAGLLFYWSSARSGSACAIGSAGLRRDDASRGGANLCPRARAKGTAGLRKGFSSGRGEHVQG